MTCVPPAPSRVEQQTNCKRYGRPKCKSTCEIDALPTVNTVVFFYYLIFSCMHTYACTPFAKKNHYVDRENCVYVHCRELYMRVTSRTSAGRCEIDRWENTFFEVFIRKKTIIFTTTRHPNLFLSTKIQTVQDVHTEYCFEITFHKFWDYSHGVKKKLKNRFKQIFRTPLHSNAWYSNLSANRQNVFELLGHTISNSSMMLIALLSFIFSGRFKSGEYAGEKANIETVFLT